MGACNMQRKTDASSFLTFERPKGGSDKTNFISLEAAQIAKVIKVPLDNNQNHPSGIFQSIFPNSNVGMMPDNRQISLISSQLC